MRFVKFCSIVYMLVTYVAAAPIEGTTIDPDGLLHLPNNVEYGEPIDARVYFKTIEDDPDSPDNSDDYPTPGHGSSKPGDGRGA
ncbi:hypothetical protein M501DRAFT_1013375 [Patellaria atrata CBS 101060]|uniref:Secreted protein n=1 Tax=Patellaria atrata CBS 101060 TaxID=1346257 RepID=A0A9P4SHN8_9PEZI|nr:hypothetical protein M501DRAFT_1013375 [Patellaria atrata CBS 101060]